MADLTPITRKEQFYQKIINASGGGGGGGGGANVVPLSVDHNATFTAPEGTAYSPVTVNVPTTGDYTTYVKSASSVAGIQFTLDELAILNGTFCVVEVGSMRSGGFLAEDATDLYIISGLGYWFLLALIFGFITVNLNGGFTQQMYSWSVTSASAPSSYTLEGAMTITFYVTSSQKQALDAL